jgi:hypothetical protein
MASTVPTPLPELEECMVDNILVKLGRGITLSKWMQSEGSVVVHLNSDEVDLLAKILNHIIDK